MSTRFKNAHSDAVPTNDGETVAALVKMMSGIGIERSWIDAVITKAARPVVDARDPSGEIANDGNPRSRPRRSA